MIRILVADDQKMMQRTLQLSLESELDLEIVGNAEDGLSALQQIEKLKPDIVLIDIEMPRVNGLAATQIISQRFSNTKVLILSSHDNDNYVKHALNSGAKGYLLKNTPAEELIKAIHSVHQGYVQLAPGLLEKIIQVEKHLAIEQNQTKALRTITQPQPALLTTTTSSETEWAQSTRELLNTLPQVWTRGLVYCLIAFTVLVIPWTVLSKVDETGTARGRLEPQGKTFRIDAPVTATVKTIKVQEGEQVQKGQTLLELESEIVRSDLQQTQAKLEGLLNRQTQLEVMKNQLAMTNRTQQLQTQSQAEEQLELINQTKQQVTFHRTSTDVARKLLAKDEITVNRYRKLREEGAVSGLQVEEAERTMMQNQERLQKNLLDIRQAESEVKKQQSAYERIMRQGELTLMEGEKQIKQLQTQITDVQSQIRQTENQLKALQYQWQQRGIYAPIEGTIFQLPIQNAGAVVQPGQMIAQIAPRGAPLVLRAQMDSKESGFLRPGMKVKLKFDAYPFQDYGVIAGNLRWISPDSKIVQTGVAQKEVYELEIELDQLYIETDNQQIPLTPGQTATAEVVVRQRRIIDFFLDPFKKLQKSGLDL